MRPGVRYNYCQGMLDELRTDAGQRVAAADLNLLLHKCYSCQPTSLSVARRISSDNVMPSAAPVATSPG